MRCATTPQTFVAGDWKLGNLGSRADGRTIVLDWAYPGEAPPCWELAWYLALNRSRLPETKEATIERYRRALERRGVETGDWWDRQLGLCLLGMMATIAWEKAVGDEDELDWWTRRPWPARGGSGERDPVRGALPRRPQAWAADASLAYVPLARHLVARLGGELPGPRALDAGAGTGAAGDALRARRAPSSRSTSSPTCCAPLAERGPAVAADVARLPFRSGSVDVSVAAFVLNHVPDPCNAARARPGDPPGRHDPGVASSATSVPPPRRRSTRCLVAFGWTPPDWYAAVRERAEVIGTPEVLAAAARRGGARRRGGPVRAGRRRPGHPRGRALPARAGARPAFFGGLAGDAAGGVVSEAADAQSPRRGEPFRPEVLELVASVS